MAVDTEVVIAGAPAAGVQEHHSYVDWPAIIAGIVLASAISLVLLTFGSALGLSFTNFRTFEGVNPIWVGIAAASWLLWVEISSFMAGGYITGRLRRRFADATEHESDVRDGAHGLLVWAGALVVGAIIALGGLGAAFNTVGAAVSTATTAASNVAAGAAAKGAPGGGPAAALDPNAYFVDELFRLPPNGTPPQGTTVDYRGEATRILAAGAVSGSVSDEDKTYLGQLVAQNTGMPADQATARVDQVLKSINDAKAKAAEAAETARKTAVIGAFLTAASFLVSAVAAYWAAMKGGNHRDKNMVFANVFGRF